MTTVKGVDRRPPRWRFVRVGAAVVVAGAATLIATLTFSGAFAAVPTLYVGGANCTDAGQGTQDQPYCTIVQAATAAAAGQTVLVSTGTYTGKATVAHSGAAGSPIVFEPAPQASVTISGGVDGFFVSGKSYVTIQGFTISGTSSYGIYINNSTNITVADNTVTNSGNQVSMQTAAGIELAATSNSTVTGNVSDHNSDHGINVFGATSTGNIVRGNEASFNAEGWQRNANGILVTGPGNEVVGNVVHDNEDSGIQFYPGADNALATLNVSYNNGDHGIDNMGVSGGRIVGNTVYHNCTTGINVEGASGNYALENNIAVDNSVYPAYNGISCARRAGNIGIWDAASPTTTVDNNLVYLSKAGTMYAFGNVSYSSLSALQTATGQEQHGVQADPKFADAAAAKFGLLEGSPAIDAADAGMSGEQDADIVGAARYDDVADADTGRGPRTYDDLGAYEFVAHAPTAAVTATPATGSAPLSVTADASASTDPQSEALSFTFDFGDGTVVGPQASAIATHVYAAAGNYTLAVTATNTSHLTATAQTSVSASVAVLTGVYTPDGPARILDTRSKVGVSTSTPVAANGTVVLQVAGVHGVPATGVTAVAMNVTATGPTKTGFLTVYPHGQTRPTASNINWVAGTTIAGLVIVPVVDGKVSFYNGSAGTVHMIADLAGYYGSGTAATYTSDGPVRILDTRSKVGVSTSTPVAANGTVVLQVAGVHGVPATGVTAVVMNVTATGATQTGYLTVYPHGQTRPTASNINWVAGKTIANLVVVPVVDGKVSFYNGSAGTVHMIADLAGYYGSGTGATYAPLGPVRILDTRSKVGVSTSTPVAANGTVVLQVAGVHGVPTTGVTAVAMNVTVTGATQTGYLTVYPHGQTRPTASNINWVAGTTIANLVVVPVVDGKVSFYNGSAGTVHMIADLAGYFTG